MTLDLNGHLTSSPTPDQIEQAVRAVGSGDATSVILSGDELFPYVQAARDAPGVPFVLEYRDEAAGPQHQALEVPDYAVVDAFLRFAFGDRSRNPALTWGEADI